MSLRLYQDDTGTIRYLCLSGGTSGSSQAAVANTSSAASSLAQALGISGQTYSITKNGAAADSDDLAEYDVAYYDRTTNTLRVSDYKVTGYITKGEPNVSAASTLTVSGHTFDVLECAWSSLEKCRVGSSVTLLLMDDGKVAEVRPSNEVRTEMIGVLSADADDFFLQNGVWYVESNRQEYQLSGRVQIHLTAVDIWLEGYSALESILSDGYELEIYCDRSAQEGGQVRIITAK